MAIKRERVSMGASNLGDRSVNQTPRQNNQNNNYNLNSNNQLGSARDITSTGNSARMDVQSARDRNIQQSARSARSAMASTFPAIGNSGGILDPQDSRTFQVNSSHQQNSSRGPGTFDSGMKKTLSHTLRTTLLDPETALFPISKTRSELMKRISSIESRVHISFDLDNDGFVGQEDYRLAKELDSSGKGFLSSEERLRGQRIIADTFFKKHATSLEKFGGNYKNNTHEQNVESLVNGNFKLLYRKLKERERSVMATASDPVMACMQLEDDTLIKHNFYADKFDCTAWNDFDAIPRAASNYGPNDHGGSRKRLLFSRQQVSNPLNNVDVVNSGLLSPIPTSQIGPISLPSLDQLIVMLEIISFNFLPFYRKLR